MCFTRIHAHPCRTAPALSSRLARAQPARSVRTRARGMRALPAPAWHRPPVSSGWALVRPSARNVARSPRPSCTLAGLGGHDAPVHQLVSFSLPRTSIMIPLAAETGIFGLGASAVIFSMIGPGTCFSAGSAIGFGMLAVTCSLGRTGVGQKRGCCLPKSWPKSPHGSRTGALRSSAESSPRAL